MTSLATWCIDEASNMAYPMEVSVQYRSIISERRSLRIPRQERWLFRFVSLLAVTSGLVSICGCSAIADKVMKGGGKSPARIVGPGSFELDYTNTLYFERDVTISVDSLFARLLTADRATWNALQDFLRPAESLLNNTYGVTLAPTNLVPDYKNTKFVAQAGYSDWRHLRDSPSSFRNITKPNKSLRDLRCRTKLVHAEIEFNSLTPRRLFFQVKLIVEIQGLSRAEDWQYVELDPESVARVGSHLAWDLISSYNEYLKLRYGIEVLSTEDKTSEDFESLD